MIVDSIIIRPVPNRRFIDYGRIRLPRFWLRFTGRCEEEFFFELFAIPTLINRILSVFSDGAVPIAIGWVYGESLCRRCLDEPLEAGCDGLLAFRIKRTEG